MADDEGLAALTEDYGGDAGLWTKLHSGLQAGQPSPLGGAWWEWRGQVSA